MSFFEAGSGSGWDGGGSDHRLAGLYDFILIIK